MANHKRYNPAQEGIDALRAENEAQRMADQYKALLRHLRWLQGEIESESLPMPVDIGHQLAAVQQVMDLVNGCAEMLQNLSDNGDI